MTFGPGRSGVVLFNWNTWKWLSCALKLCHGSVHLCGSVALLSCVMGQCICMWQGQYMGDGSTCVAIVLECCYQPSLGWMLRCVTC